MLVRWPDLITKRCRNLAKTMGPDPFAPLFRFITIKYGDGDEAPYALPYRHLTPTQGTRPVCYLSRNNYLVF